MSPRRWIAAAAGAAVAGAFVVSLAAGEEGPETLLDGNEIRDLLGILESRAFRDPEYCDLREAALTHLRREVEAGGPALRDLALLRVRDATGDDRRRAELVLSQLPRLPEDSVRPLLAHDDPAVSLWAHLVLSRQGAEGPSPWDETVPAAPGSVVPGQPFERDPLLDVESRIREAVGEFVIVDGVAMVSADHGEDEIWRYEFDRRTFDLDGDRVSEHCVVAHLGGRIEFVAVLRRPDASGAWQLTALHRPEFAHHPEIRIDDLDGDRRPEFAFEYNNCGSPTYGGMTVFSAKQRRFVAAPSSYHAPVRVLRRHPGEPPVLVSRESYHCNWGGTAIRDVGACATEYELHRWNGTDFEPVGAAWLPQGE